jgi:tetratricopeptide (TPR) repeat protein
MELTLRPHHKNTFPLRGLLIRHASVATWIKELQHLQVSLPEISIYPVPNLAPNTIWGCLVTFGADIGKAQAGRHELCQAVSDNLFIPEKSALYPVLTDAEMQKLFASGKHIIHPEFGVVELTETLNILALVNPPVLKPVAVTRPHAPVFIPKTIRGFQVHTIPPEEVLKNLSENIFPRHEKLKDKPLNVLEKARLGLYRMIFSKKKDESAGNTVDGAVEKTGLGAKLESFFDKLFPSNNKWNRLQQDFEDLEDRNRKQIDKLMDLLKNNPDEALKYAIPLDPGQSTRGGEASQLDLSKRWLDFSLFSSSGRGSGSGAINLGDHFYQLQNQYNATAEELLKKNEYQKAAFVYMKLLKNYSKAAEALEAGKYYQEAATVYLKHAGNKRRAAECYEKGNMITDAIGLYKELSENEKVGDLYMSISNRPEAMAHYEKVVSHYKTRNQYVKASLLCRNKMNDGAAAQSLLLEGWKTNKDAVNCLNNYFSGIADAEQLGREINAIYAHDVNEQNRENFLSVIQHEFNKKSELREPLQDMAYEIVAAQIAVNPSIASALRHFNPNNKELMKDTLRFKLNSDNKGKRT